MSAYQPAPDLLRERTVVVTGAGDGIGRAVSLAAARYGATVVLLGRTIKKLEQVYDQIEAAGAPQPAIYPMNLEGATPKDYEDLANVIGTKFGQLHGLVHAAAELGDLRPIAHYDPLTWVKVVHVNLTAPFLLTQACLGTLRVAPSAAVIFSHDSVADKGRAYWGAYGVSKGGALTLMKILAEELESHTQVRVNAVDPGPTRTGLRLQAYPAEDRDRLSTPDQVVWPYLFLLGADGQAVNGQVLRPSDPVPIPVGG